MNDSDDLGRDEANRAAEAILATLDQWTSKSAPLDHTILDIGNTRMDMENDTVGGSYMYQGNSDMWLEEENDGDDYVDEYMDDANTTLFKVSKLPTSMVPAYKDAVVATNSTELESTEISMNSTPARAGSVGASLAAAHRAGTPVMSNSSSGRRTNESRGSIVTTVSTPAAPYNVQSPWMSGVNDTGTTTPQSTNNMAMEHDNTAASASVTLTTTTLFPRKSPLMITKQKYTDYRRYHDAVETLVRHKRHLRHLQSPSLVNVDVDDMDQEVAVAAAVAATTTTPATRDLLQRQDQEAEVAFLSTLNVNAWSSHGHDFDSTTSQSSSSQIEGNAWKLLQVLRQLGRDAVLWDDTPAAAARHQNALAVYLEQLAFDLTLSPPAAVVAALYGNAQEQHVPAPASNAPLVWRRRHSVLQWLETCFKQVLPMNVCRPLTTKVDTTKSRDNVNVVEQGVYRTHQDAQLMQSSLALLLAGQFPKALALWRDSDVAWRAKMWSGGEPHACTETNGAVTTTTVAEDSTSLTHKQGDAKENATLNRGNPRRALWRGIMWKHAEALHVHTVTSSTSSPRCPYETAIIALLGSHVTAAVDCDALRTWDRQLYAIWRTMMDRTIDEVLHMHNNHRRQLNPPFFGAALGEKSEVEQLALTASLAGMNEAKAVKHLHGSPFEEIIRSNNNWILRVTSALLVGTNAFANVMAELMDELDMRKKQSEYDLRFLTHVAMYWHAMGGQGGVSSTSMATDVDEADSDDSQVWMRALVLEYVYHLNSQGYWDMIVLYSGFLQEDCIVDHLPRLLSSIEAQRDRKIVVSQLKDWLPRVGLDLRVLSGIFRLILAEPESDQSQSAPSRSDIRKMKSILWLCIRKEHFVEALVAANTLLRHFLCADNKVASATMLVRDVLNDLLLRIGEGGVDTDTEYFETARFEHSAFLLFLQAKDAVLVWNKIMDAPMTRFPDWKSFDVSIYEPMARSIAASAEKRKRVEAIRNECFAVIRTTEGTCRALRDILEYPSGWLSTDHEAVTNFPDDRERLNELQHLRHTLLPNTVNMYHDVCMQTAVCMNTSIIDAIEALGGDLSRKEVIALIDEASSGQTLSPLSPRYWTKRALEVMHIVENEANKIRPVLDVKGFQDIVARMASSAELDLKYRDLEA